MRCRTTLVIPLAVLAAATVAGCPWFQPAAPDLIVQSVSRPSGTVPTVNTDDSIRLPITVVVRNQGTAPAGPFKVAAYYTGPDSSDYEAPFTVAGEGDAFLPSTDADLPSGAEVTFTGDMTIDWSMRGQTAGVFAIADSPGHDATLPAEGAVAESDETNNVSSTLTVTMP